MCIIQGTVFTNRLQCIIIVIWTYYIFSEMSMRPFFLHKVKLLFSFDFDYTGSEVQKIVVTKMLHNFIKLES